MVAAAGFQAGGAVMPSLVPGIHVLKSSRIKDVDGRVKPGHDGGKIDSLPDGLHLSLGTGTA
jgi:hypothetical protein